jgi:hypothetical protein
MEYGRTNEMQRLPVGPVVAGGGTDSGTSPSGKSSEEENPEPVPALQEATDDGHRDSSDHRPSSGNIRLTCFICRRIAVAIDNGFFHCKEHHDKSIAGKSERQMFDEAKNEGTMPKV